MGQQARADISNVPFIRSGDSFAKDDATIKQDAGRVAALAPLTLMGKSIVLATSITADVGNTGDGTFTALALAPGGPPRAGSWNLECVGAVVNGGVFKLEDPDGNIVVNDLTMTVGAGAATVFIAGGMTFTITDGATDFIVGDKAAIVITADGDFKPLTTGALDGSASVAGIYAGESIAAADIVAGDVVDRAMIVGGALTFDSSQLVIEGSLTLDTVLPSGKTIRDELAALGMFAETTVDADSQET